MMLFYQPPLLPFFFMPDTYIHIYETQSAFVSLPYPERMMLTSFPCSGNDNASIRNVRYVWE